VIKMEAIILAGGLGTRLKSEVSDMPKSMAAIQTRPFLEYLLDQLIDQGVHRVILSLGYKSEHIQNHFHNAYKNCEIVYAIESTQLGTGGAIKNAMPYVLGNDVIIVNGDSIFITDIQAQMNAHLTEKAKVTIALKPMKNIERYGTVDLNPNNRVLRFNEKQPLEEGLINTGMYIFNVPTFQSLDFPTKFSIEKDFFETHLEKLLFIGITSHGYFLDIGIPKDFQKAQFELGVFPQIDNTWTLFLDRDGVINKKRDNDYVKNLDELELLPNAAKDIAALSKIFGRVVIVTNQQGVGKKLMSTRDVEKIHTHIRQMVENENGLIDAIYYAPQLESENSSMRKPEIGMALRAKVDFNEIEFSKSIMVGDSPSDMEFGKRANMFQVFVRTDTRSIIHEDFNYTIPSLSIFSEILKSILWRRSNEAVS